MPQKTTTFRIMIAAPRDASKEAKKAVELIYKWNRLHSLERAITLQPLYWEFDTPVGTAGCTQDIIDANLVDKSDMIVAIFNASLGSASSSSMPYTIGEIKRHVESGRQAALFFKTGRRIDYTRLTADEKKRINLVSRFQQKPSKYLGVNVFYQRYSSSRDFADSFSDQLERAVQTHLLPMISAACPSVTTLGSVAIDRLSLKMRMAEARKNIFISGFSLRATIDNTFFDWIPKDVNEVRMVMCYNSPGLLEHLTHFTSKSYRELVDQVKITYLRHSGYRDSRVTIRALDSVMTVGLVGIDIDQPDGKIYIQQHLYGRRASFGPHFACFAGDHLFEVYRQVIEDMWKGSKNFNSLSSYL